MLLKASKSEPPVGAIIVSRLVHKSVPSKVEWGQETAMDIGGVVLNTSENIIRYGSELL